MFGNTLQVSKKINVKDKLIDSWTPTELKKTRLEKEGISKKLFYDVKVMNRGDNNNKQWINDQHCRM